MRLLAQPELTENPTARKFETYIQTGRRGGEDSCGRGGTETGRVWDERGRESDDWQTPQPHTRAQINWD